MTTNAELDAMRERNRLAYLAQVQAAAPQPEPYRGSDALSARRRAAKDQIRQALADARAARQNPEEQQ